MAWNTLKNILRNPMTAVGDIIVGSTGGTAGRLAKGNENQMPAVGASTLEYRNTGFLKFNEVTATRDLAVTDAAKGAVDANHATTKIVLTIPKDTFAVGDTIVVFRQGAAEVDIKGGTDTTLNGVSAGTGALTTSATIRCVASNTFKLYGDHGAVA